MSDALTFAEIDGLHVEMLPVRTVLSTAGPDMTGGNASAMSGDVNNVFPHFTKGVVIVDADTGHADSIGGKGLAFDD